MPEIEWADAYKTKRPEFLDNEINAYFSKMSESDPNIDRNIIERIKQHFRFMAITVPEPRKADKQSDPNSKGSPRDGGGGRRVPRREGADGDRMYSVQRGLIIVKSGEVSDPRFPIEINFDQPEPVGIVNITHPLIHDAWMCCKEKLVSDCVEEGAEMDSYYAAFKGQVMGHIACALTHIWAFVKKGNLSLRDEIMKPAALVGIAAGIQHFKQAAQGPFGTIKAGNLLRK